MSKIERRIRPAPPIMDPRIAKVDKILSLRRMLGTKLRKPIQSHDTKYEGRCIAYRPRCRSHLSRIKAKTKHTAVTEQPAMKSGLRKDAPTSEI